MSCPELNITVPEIETAASGSATETSASPARRSLARRQQPEHEGRDEARSERGAGDDEREDDHGQNR